MDDFGAFILFAVIAIAAYFIIVNFWPFLLVGGIIALIVWILYLVHASKVKKLQDEIERQKQVDEHNKLVADVNNLGFWTFEYRGVVTTNYKSAMILLNEIIKYPIIIDTNIWMDENLCGFWQSLFDECSRYHSRVTIPSSVYDEIIRIKKDKSRFKKSCRARLAQDRIMTFSNADLLNIANIKKIADPYAYADVDIINMCEYVLSKTNAPNFSLITNDADLTLRTRHILNEQKYSREVCKILAIGRTQYSGQWTELKKYLTE